MEIKKKGEMVEQELRSTIREIMVKEAEIEQLEQQKQVLNDRCTSISNENAGLQMRTKEEEDNVRKVLAQFGSYRKKMEGHRLAVWLAASQGETQKVLGKKALVRKLKKKREELRDDLQNPNGSTVEKAKVKDIEKVVCVEVFGLCRNLRFLLFNNCRGRWMP